MSKTSNQKSAKCPTCGRLHPPPPCPDCGGETKLVRTSTLDLGHSVIEKRYYYCKSSNCSGSITTTDTVQTQSKSGGRSQCRVCGAKNRTVVTIQKRVPGKRNSFAKRKVKMCLECRKKIRGTYRIYVN